MATPGIITGGNLNKIFRSIEDGTATEALTRQGVFADNPGSTAKYARNRGALIAEYPESMARLFIDVPEKQIKRFMSTVAPASRPLAKVLTSAAGTGGSGATGFVDFLMTGTQENFQEKSQIVDTLTDNYVAFYSGEEPPLFHYTGVLLNTYQDDQRVWMLQLYRDILRGTRLANRGRIASLRYDSFIVSGYLETLNLGLTGETEHTASSFSFSMRIKRMRVITAALSLPTVVSTGVFEGVSSSTDTEHKEHRTGSVTPETPPTATIGPGASSVGLVADAARDAETRKSLRAQGFSDSEISTALQTAKLTKTPPETDSREVAVSKAYQGVDRVAIKDNPEGASNDAAEGQSNILGVYGSSDPVPLRPIPGNRSRGMRQVA